MACSLVDVRFMDDVLSNEVEGYLALGKSRSLETERSCGSELDEGEGEEGKEGEAGHLDRMCVCGV